MRIQDKLEDAYRELNLKPWANLQEVKNAYRELALLWHPDRFNARPGHLTRAHHKMTRINLAYERIRKALSRKPHPRPAPPGKKTESARPRNRHPSGETRTNSLGMKFAAVSGTSVLFSIWGTRVQDYAAYAQSAGAVDRSWQTPPFSQTIAHPVVNVSWDDANNFCRWLTEKERREAKLSPGTEYRLPSDAEWSWAVGIGDRELDGTPKAKSMKLTDAYPWGMEWPPPKGAGNYDPSLGIDSFDHTSPVGSFAPNAHGLFDLGGNVWEWCEDFLNGAPGPRVLRGASWNFSGAGHLLSSYRNGALPGARSGGIGFRCVLVEAAPPR
jgi:curved DNA-binding protein CbpA